MKKRPRRRVQARSLLDATPDWYKDAIIYELHVRAFYDSNGDGIGDFKGLAEKLDYLHDLGITAIWLLPFYPSPLKDDGYDIADYTNVHPNYGALSDFKFFLKEAHRRGIRVITELVINHTSDAHPWFQRAREAPKKSKWRDFYVWSDDPTKYQDTRVIFQDFESLNWSWDNKANAYFWHRFYSHQPDLNFDNPAVRKAVFKVLDFWFDMGVDGLRLDAVPYLYEREGTNCENLPETHDFLKELRRHVDRKHENKMLLAEANMWPEDAVTYFGDGDECHMNFHFPLMPRMFMALQMEDHFPIVDILNQTPEIPDNAQWALFLRNHDELTLEMVTDEDRDYMYRVFASDPRARINLGIRRRLAPLLDNNRRRVELMNAILFSLPGTPVIYYADEIGMGDNIYLGDRNGVRTPMQWSGDRNAGFSKANPQKLFLPVVVDPQYHYEAVNVEAQQQNTHSLLWWMKRLLDLRKKHPVFGRGNMEILNVPNRRVLAFLRTFEDEQILVVASLSRFAQSVHLDLSAHRGKVLVELFGQTEFPPIKKTPYFLSLGPYEFFWFTIKKPQEANGSRDRSRRRRKAPILRVSESWRELLETKKTRERTEDAIEKFIVHQRWYRGKAKEILDTEIVDYIDAGSKGVDVILLIVRVSYVGNERSIYLMPVSAMPMGRNDDVKKDWEDIIIAQLRVGDRKRSNPCLIDASQLEDTAKLFFDVMDRRRKISGKGGVLTGRNNRYFRRRHGRGEPPPPASKLGAEQSNTSIKFSDQFLLKIFRQLEEGVNPDLEISQYLTEVSDFQNTPEICGSIEYQTKKGGAITLGILQAYLPNQGDAWRYTLDAVADYFERALVKIAQGIEAQIPSGSIVDLSEEVIPEEVNELFGSFPLMIEKLSQRTAEMHLALSKGKRGSVFSAESFPPHYQRSLYQSVRSQVQQAMDLLAENRRTLPSETRAAAENVLDRRPEVLKTIRKLLQMKLTTKRIRCHGDFHLGQVLFTGNDFYIIDFEGEPARPLSERKIKRSPLRDVAGLIRSIDYAMMNTIRSDRIRAEDRERLLPWGRLWSKWMAAIFLRTYLEEMSAGNLLPRNMAELRSLMELYLIDKSAYEIRYELNNRPEWVDIPIRGILDLISEG